MIQDHNMPSGEQTVSVARYHKQQMKPWESLVDKKIREAMEAGEFDNLTGSGQPIDLSENPFEDPDCAHGASAFAQCRLRAVLD